MPALPSPACARWEALNSGQSHAHLLKQCLTENSGRDASQKRQTGAGEVAWKLSVCLIALREDQGSNLITHIRQIKVLIISVCACTWYKQMNASI